MLPTDITSKFDPPVFFRWKPHPKSFQNPSPFLDGDRKNMNGIIPAIGNEAHKRPVLNLFSYFWRRSLNETTALRYRPDVGLTVFGEACFVVHALSMRRFKKFPQRT